MVRGFQTKAKCLALDQETERACWCLGVRGNESDDTAECVCKYPFKKWDAFSAAAVDYAGDSLQHCILQTIISKLEG